MMDYQGCYIFLKMEVCTAHEPATDETIVEHAKHLAVEHAGNIMGCVCNVHVTNKSVDGAHHCSQHRGGSQIMSSMANGIVESDYAMQNIRPHDPGLY
jgi:hypothetical protein